MKHPLLFFTLAYHGRKVKEKNDKYDQPGLFYITGDRKIICVFEFIDADGENVDQPADPE